MQRATGTLAGLLLAVTLPIAMPPAPADAMCCACRDCAVSGFCIDGVANALACATLCVSAQCASTTFDSVDSCAGGCDGAPVEPTATASNTPSVTATATATGTATETATLSPTPVATGTETPTASPTATPALSGQISYYANDLPVEDVTVTLSGATNDTAMTDADGIFRFASVASGMQTLEPTKDGDFNVAVTALDATEILQFVAGMMGVEFTDNQLLAADVTGDGTVSSLDATRILQFQAGTLTRFEVADECQSDWLFRPSPAMIPNQTLVEPEISADLCVQGAIVYGAGFMPPASGQDFTAILFGDVTGNWMPAAP
jgi:hypothetical protein